MYEIHSILFKKGIKKPLIQQVFKDLNVYPIRPPNFSQKYIRYRIRIPTKSFYSVGKPYGIIVYQQKI